MAIARRSGGRGDGEADLGAAGGSVRRLDGAAVGHDEVAGDGQAEAAAPGVGGAGEALEDRRQLVGGEAGAGVGDGEADERVLAWSRPPPTVPPSGVWRTALDRRLARTWRMRVGSTSISGRPSATVDSSRTPLRRRSRRGPPPRPPPGPTGGSARGAGSAGRRRPGPGCGGRRPAGPAAGSPPAASPGGGRRGGGCRRAGPRSRSGGRPAACAARG